VSNLLRTYKRAAGMWTRTKGLAKKQGSTLPKGIEGSPKQKRAAKKARVR
jgi:hypothetical protein